MKKRLSLILTLLLALVVQVTFAQQKQVTGTVSDQEGMPLPGVNVLVKDTSRGTMTDFDGNYSIEVSVGETLVFSFLGFETVEHVVGTNSQINVQLGEDAAVLEEVVVEEKEPHPPAGVPEEENSVFPEAWFGKNRIPRLPQR